MFGLENITHWNNGSDMAVNFIFNYKKKLLLQQNMVMQSVWIKLWYFYMLTECLWMAYYILFMIKITFW